MDLDIVPMGKAMKCPAMDNVIPDKHLDSITLTQDHIFLSLRDLDSVLA